MTNYDFSTLSYYDFELLVCDLFNALRKKNNQSELFRVFKQGRDRGIDLLLSSEKNDYEIIVQVKHFSNSSYSNLKSSLKNKEKQKVDILNPISYKVVTSLGLTVNNKQEIKTIFGPYISSLNDIYGREDINLLISENPSIEENHFKLWYSSTNVLRKILNYKYEGRRNEFEESSLKRKVRLYVPTLDYQRTLKTLNNQKLVILTGDPGVGKSTLSEMIIYNYLKEDFDLSIAYDSITEIENQIKMNDEKQVFYFDDFLGHTQKEIDKAKSAESSLLRIINRIRQLKNKYIILNTRKFILNSFSEESEKFKRFFSIIVESKIELSNYSFELKQRIFENHILESKLDDSQKRILNNLNVDVCGHRNFSPRMAEFFTSEKVLKFKNDELQKFIYKNLEKPMKIWEHAYNQQISVYDRFLLNTLLSLKGSEEYSILEKANNKRLDYEVKNNNYVKPINAYNNSLRILNDGFIVYNDYNNYVSFINSSLEDYLRLFLKTNKSEVFRILSSAITIDQWYYFFEPFNSESRFIEELINPFKQFRPLFNSSLCSSKNLYLSAIFTFCFIDKNDEYIENVIKNTYDWSFLSLDDTTADYSLNFLNNAKSLSKLNLLIANLELKFFFHSFLSINSFYKIYEVVRLLTKHYEIDLLKFIQVLRKHDGDSLLNLIEHVEYLTEEEVELIYIFLNNNTETNLYIEYVEDFEENFKFLKNCFIKNLDTDYRKLKENDWNEIARINYLKRIETNKIDYDDIYEKYSGDSEL